MRVHLACRRRTHGWVPGSIGKTIEIFPLVLLLIRSHADHITSSHLHSSTSGGTDVSLQGYARLFTIPSHLPWGVGRSCTKELCTSPSISMDTAGSNLHQTRFTLTTPRLRTFVEYYMDGLRQVRCTCMYTRPTVPSNPEYSIAVRNEKKIKRLLFHTRTAM